MEEAPFPSDLDINDSQAVVAAIRKLPTDAQVEMVWSMLLQLEGNPEAITPAQFGNILIEWGRAGGDITAFFARAFQEKPDLAEGSLLQIPQLLLTLTSIDPDVMAQWAWKSTPQRMAAVLRALEGPQPTAIIQQLYHADSSKVLPVLDELSDPDTEATDKVLRQLATYPEDTIVASWAASHPPQKVVKLLQSMDIETAKVIIQKLAVRIGNDKAAMLLNAVRQ